MTKKNRNRQGERGVALFLAVFALLLLTGIAAALLFMSNTDSSINANYRNEQTAYFSAKAGLEEARARAMTSDPASISGFLAQEAPTAAKPDVVYIVNSNLGAQPWVSTDTYADDELCHDGYAGLGYTGGPGLAITPPDVRCVDGSGNAILPATSTWYQQQNSTLPFHGTSEALPYAWVRVAPKLNGSVTYLHGSGSTATTQTYTVNSTVAVQDPICWDGQEEVPLGPTYTSCSQMFSASRAPMTFVYLVTSLGVGGNNARKVVQSEIALQPTPPFPYGLYATSNNCPAINFTGSNPATDSYTTAGGGTYSTTKSSTGGDIGSNGSVDVQNGDIGGIVGVLAPGVSCPQPVTIGPGGKMVGTVGCPSGSSDPTKCYLPAPYTFPTPPAPNPLPPNTSYTPANCGGGTPGKCITPGTYGNITVNGTLTMAPGIYNINSVSMGGNGAIVVNPPGAVVLNIAGTGQSMPLTIDGNGITDDTNPNDFIINYGGAGTVNIKGNGDVTAILNAPLAVVTQAGNGNWYGSMVMSQATIGGNAFFHYDVASALAPNNNGPFTLISYRLVPY